MLPTNSRHLHIAALSLAVVLCVAMGHNALGDVVHLKNGKKIEGVVRNKDAKSPQLTVQTTLGNMSVPRDQVARIEEEGGAQSLARLADEYMKNDNYQQAAEYYQQALKSDPNLASAAKGLQLAQEEIRLLEAQRQAAVAKTVDEAIGQVESYVKEKKYKEAYYLGRSIDISTAPELKERYTKVATATAYQLGLALLDAQDPVRAEKAFTTSLRFDSSNEEARRQLAKIWQGDPGKIDKVLEEYRKSDKVEDQLKAADLLLKTKRHEEAFQIYTQYAQGWATWPIERLTSVRHALRTLETEFAVNSNFEMAMKARAAFNMCTPGADEEPLLRYECKFQAQKTDMKDPNAVADLGAFVEARGFSDQARKIYVAALQMDPKQVVAFEGLNRLGQIALQDLAVLYSDAQFDLAAIRAEQVIRDFAAAPDIVAIAQNMRNKGQAAQQQMQQDAQQRAAAYARRGDDYHAQAQAYLSAYVNKDFNANTRVVSPKEEAAKYYRLAIQTWQTALALDPSLADPIASDLANKINEASARLATLTSTAQPYMPRYERQ